MAQFRLLISFLSATLPSLFILGVFSSTKFTIVNNCNQTVWLVMTPLSTTGFVLETGESKIVNIPSNWSGRVWGRTHCAQNQSTGEFSCVTGDCGTGKMECGIKTGLPPATLAEFTLDSFNRMDFYDVSLVDGFNLPLLVVPQGRIGGSCNSTGCEVDLNGVCPWELSVTSNSQGDVVVGCRSPCDKLENQMFCCIGEYSSPNNCKPTLYSELFKKSCPLAYSYAYDDATSTFTCAGADYLITFCPSPSTSGASSSTFMLVCSLDATF